MPEPSSMERALGRIREQLEAKQVSPRVVARTLAELREHTEDVRLELIDCGHTPCAAERAALERLGDARSIARAAAAYPELGAWWKRFPHLAAVAYPLACVAVLPAVPVIAGLHNAVWLGRWLMCAAAGGAVTAMLFLLLQFSITLS
ncbi:MAG: hypothetical protein AAGE85_07475 [Pseudomonadota bacterium]